MNKRYPSLEAASNRNRSIRYLSKHSLGFLSGQYTRYSTDLKE